MSRLSYESNIVYIVAPTAMAIWEGLISHINYTIVAKIFVGKTHTEAGETDLGLSPTKQKANIFSYSGQNALMKFCIAN